MVLYTKLPGRKLAWAAIISQFILLLIYHNFKPYIATIHITFSRQHNDSWNLPRFPTNKLLINIARQLLTSPLLQETSSSFLPDFFLVPDCLKKPDTIHLRFFPVHGLTMDFIVALLYHSVVSSNCIKNKLFLPFLPVLRCPCTS